MDGKDSCIEFSSMGSVSTYIHHQIAIIVTTSGDVNRHSSSFKMATVLEEWTKEVRSVIRFYGQKKVPPVEIHLEQVTVCGANAMTVQHVLKLCREFDSGRVNVMGEQRSGLRFTSADLVQDIDAAVQADRRVSIAELEIRFNLSRGTI
jgi:hypothetical protein